MFEKVISFLESLPKEARRFEIYTSRGSFPDALGLLCPTLGEVPDSLQDCSIAELLINRHRLSFKKRTELWRELQEFNLTLEQAAALQWINDCPACTKLDSPMRYWFVLGVLKKLKEGRESLEWWLDQAERAAESETVEGPKEPLLSSPRAA